MDPDLQTIRIDALAKTIRAHVQESEIKAGPQTKKLLLDLVVDIGNQLKNQYKTGFNQERWLFDCGVTADYQKQAAQAA